MNEELKSLKVFSKKLNEVMDILSCNDKFVPAMAYSNWLDNGWNNYRETWMNEGWNNYGSTWTDSGWSNSGGGGGCYITTATVDHLGFADDCDELNMLRMYRDKLAEEDPEFKKIVLEYYKTAPQIVEKISNSSDKDEVLDGLYADMILPVLSLLKQGKIEEAKTHYIKKYEELKAQYILEPQKQLIKK